MNEKDATVRIITITGLFVLCIISLLKLNKEEWYYGLILGLLVVAIIFLCWTFWQRIYLIQILTDIIKEHCNKNNSEVELKTEIEELQNTISTLKINYSEYAKDIDKLKKEINELCEKSSHNYWQ